MIFAIWVMGGRGSKEQRQVGVSAAVISPCKTDGIPHNWNKTSSLARRKREFGTRFYSNRNAILGSQESMKGMRRSH